MKRERFIYFVLIMIVIVLGLSSRKFGANLPKFIAEYSGDTFWGLMVYLCFGFWLNKSEIKKVAIFSLIFSYCIEFSQLYQAGWINNIRVTKLGGLILGKGFLVSDLICYTVGIFIGGFLESIINKMDNQV